MTTTNDKLRSLFLAALMVFSVFAMTVALPGSAAANHDELGVDADTHLQTGATATFWGQEAFFQTPDNSSENWQLRSLNDDDEPTGSTVEQIYVNEDGTATVNTDGLDGTYVLTSESGKYAVINPSGEVTGFVPEGSNGVPSEAHFSVTTQTLDADFESSNVNDDTSDFELEFDSNRGQYDVNVSSDSLDSSELATIFSNFDNVEEHEDDDVITLGDVTDGTYETDFTDADTGEHTFDFEVNDTSAASSASVNVSEAADGSTSFGEDFVQDQAGDVADITVELDNTDDGTVTIGSEEQNYWIIAHVEDDNDDGEVNLEFNSYTAGTYDENGNTVLTAEDSSDDSVTIQEEGGTYSDVTTADEDLLESFDYDMNVSAGDTYDTDNYQDADAAGTLRLTDRSTNNVTIMTAPDGFSDWDTDTVVAGMGSNVTESDEIANGDYAVVQIDASGLEGYYDSLASENKSQFLTSNDSQPTRLTVEESGGANSPDNEVDWGAVNPSIVSDGDNNTYYVALDTDSSNNFFSSDEEYTAEFSVTGSADDYNGDNPLNVDSDDENEAISGDFEVVDAETELDTNEDELVLVEAADNQSISGSSTWAPGTELTVAVESQDTTSPFLTRPDGEVQPDGTFEVSADFSDLSAGTNLSLEVDGEEYDGRVVEQVDQETETATPNETATPTETATDEPTEAGSPSETTTPTDADTDTPTDDSGPGFTVVAALGALIAAALLAVRRNN